MNDPSDEIMFPVQGFRVTLDVLCFNGKWSANDIRGSFESNKYLSVKVRKICQKDLLWNDNHPINIISTSSQAAENHFKDAPVVWERPQ